MPQRKAAVALSMAAQFSSREFTANRGLCGAWKGTSTLLIEFKYDFTYSLPFHPDQTIGGTTMSCVLSLLMIGWRIFE